MALARRLQALVILAAAILACSACAGPLDDVVARTSVIVPDSAPRAFLGGALAPLGDLDGDGRRDLAVGDLGLETGTTETDDDGAVRTGGRSGAGGVWILSLDADGEVAGRTLLAPGLSGLDSDLAAHRGFGHALASLGDLDGDGVTDLALGTFGVPGARGADDGAVLIVFLERDGSVKRSVRIDASTEALPGRLDARSGFGRALAWLGDVDGDGLGELAVSARQNPFAALDAEKAASAGDDGAHDDAAARGASAWRAGSGWSAGRGVVWILSLDAAGVVRSGRLLASREGVYGLDEPWSATIGSSLANLGDLDGDGSLELAVGAYGVGYGGELRLVSIDRSLTIVDEHVIDATALADDGRPSGLASSVARLPDRDGRARLVVGSPGYRQSEASFVDGGAIFVLGLDRDLSVVERRRLDGRDVGRYPPSDGFGDALAVLDDLDGDGQPELAVGAEFDGGRGGGVWLLFLRAPEFWLAGDA